MPRLPTPGQDNNSWGDILNDFLMQSHKSNGLLLDGSVITPTLSDGAVTTSKITDATISEIKLASAVRTKLNQAIPEQFNPVAGSNVSLTGTYPDITINAASGGGSGSISSVTSMNANLTVTNPTTTPQLTVVASPKLSTARNINGVAFDGTANITVTDATKEPLITAGTTADYFRGDKTFQTLNKTVVGLSNVDNTNDANKPVSSATQAALNAKQPLSEKGAANGYAGLSANALVPTTQLASGAASSITFLRGDGTWASVPAATSSNDPYILNLRDYGAIFDGSTDIRTALQTAINDATTLANNGAWVVIQAPAGVGIISSTAATSYSAPNGSNYGANIGFGLPVNLSGGIIIRGTGKFATTFKLTASSINLFYVKQTANYDVAKNIIFEDFGVNNNAVSGRSHIVFGSQPGFDTPLRYISFDNIHAYRIKVFNVPFDSAMTTTKKASFIYRGRHAGDYEGGSTSGTAPNVWTGYSSSGWTYTRNVTFTDIETYDAQRAILVVSDITQNTAHWYDQVHILRCRHEQNTPYAGTVAQTSFYIGGNCQGGFASIKDSISINVGDDAIESGGLQSLLIDNFTAVNACLNGILVRFSQPPQDPSSVAVTVNNLKNIITADATQAGGSTRARAFELKTENDAAAMSIGSVTITNSVTEIQGGLYSAFGGQRSHLLGWNMTGPINKVVMQGCSAVVRNVTYDTSSGTQIVNFLNLRVFSTGAENFSTVVVKDYSVVIENLSSTGGLLEIIGAVPSGNGSVTIDGFDMMTKNCSSAVVARAALVQPGYRPAAFTTPLVARSVRLRRITGQSMGSTYVTRRGIRVFNDDTFGSLLIADSDLASFSSTIDLDLSGAGTMAGVTQIADTNTYNLVPLGGMRNPQAANYFLRSYDRYVAVTSTASARTMTLPLAANVPVGRIYSIIDESNGASANNITISAAGSDTFIGGATTKTIATNGGKLDVYSNGSNWMVR